MTEDCHQEGGGSEQALSRGRETKAEKRKARYGNDGLDSVVLVASFKLRLLHNSKKCRNGLAEEQGEQSAHREFRAEGTPSLPGEPYDVGAPRSLPRVHTFWGMKELR